MKGNAGREPNEQVIETSVPLSCVMYLYLCVRSLGCSGGCVPKVLAHVELGVHVFVELELVWRES